MKRWIVWSFVSIFTFTAGTFVAFAFLNLSESSKSKEPTAPPPVIAQIAEQHTASTDPPAADDGFNPEIIDIDLATLAIEREPDHDFNNLIDSGIEVSEHYDEIKRGDKKFVMFADAGQYRIRKTPAVTSKRKEDGYSIVTIDFKGKGRPVFTFADLSFLKNGRIKTVYLRPKQSEIDERGLPIAYSLWLNEIRSFSLGDKHYSLRITKGTASDGKKLEVLILEKDSDRQVLDAVPYYAGGDRGFADIVWAGDLDHDGDLDLITEGSEGTFTCRPRQHTEASSN